MAVGEAVIGRDSVADNSYLTIQPGSGSEYMIMNIYANGKFEVYMYDGTNDIYVQNSNSEPYSLSIFKFLCKNTDYLRVKNVSGATMHIGYSGMQIK